MTGITTVISYGLMAIGVIFNLSGAVGLIRLPDVYNRLQASTKCVTLGTSLILFSVFVRVGLTPLGIKALLTIIFILLTSPTAAHALSRGAYKSGVKLWEGSVCDHYKDKKETGE